MSQVRIRVLLCELSLEVVRGVHTALLRPSHGVAQHHARAGPGCFLTHVHGVMFYDSSLTFSQTGLHDHAIWLCSSRWTRVPKRLGTVVASTGSVLWGCLSISPVSCHVGSASAAAACELLPVSLLVLQAAVALRSSSVVWLGLLVSLERTLVLLLRFWCRIAPRLHRNRKAIVGHLVSIVQKSARVRSRCQH
jgi:hypothetical protein